MRNLMLLDDVWKLEWREEFIPDGTATRYNLTTADQTADEARTQRLLLRHRPGCQPADWWALLNFAWWIGFSVYLTSRSQEHRPVLKIYPSCIIFSSTRRIRGWKSSLPQFQLQGVISKQCICDSVLGPGAYLLQSTILSQSYESVWPLVSFLAYVIF